MTGTQGEVTLRFMAAPTDAGLTGTVDGGRVLAAHVVATGWHGGSAIAAYAGGVRFSRPLLSGDLVEVEARLLRTGTTSMHLSVRVRSGGPRTGELHPTTCGTIVVVALDEDSRKTPVRPWHPVSEEDMALETHARYVIGVRERLRRHEPADPPPSRGAAR